MWTCIWNHFAPFWSISQASSEAGPQRRSALEAYVKRPDLGQFHKLLRVMEADRTIERAVVVGQRGAGKSMDLAWLAYRLSKTHLVFWIDALEESEDFLQDPIGLFMAIGSAVYEGARKSNCEPDRGLFEAFLSTCLYKKTYEQVSGEKLKLRVDKALQSLAQSVSQVCLPTGFATANPIFIAAGGAAAFVDWLLDSIEFSKDVEDVQKRTGTFEPDVGAAATRLTTFVQDVEARCERSIVVVVDGLDRVDAEQVRGLFQRGLDLARPRLRLILTAPLALYATPEFDQLQDFFSQVVTSPNLSIADSQSEAWQFMEQVVKRRLSFCGKTVEEVFEANILTRLIEASGGNIRQLILLVREASLHSDLKSENTINDRSVDKAINAAQAELINRMAAEHLDALRNFFSKGDPRIPPEGDLRDELLRSKFVLVYQEGAYFRYKLHPLIEAYLIEEGYYDGA